MPLQKYYCDYCDKQFQDTPSARKRHLQSSQHLRARALWYDALKRDPSGLFLQHKPGLCHHFVRMGFCKYGDACKYVHPKQGILGSSQTAPHSVQSPASLGNQQLGSNPVMRDIAGHTGLSYDNLPPSLRPPPEGGYPPPPFIDWG